MLLFVMIMIQLGDSLGSMVIHDGIVGIGHKNIQLHLGLVFGLLWEFLTKFYMGTRREIILGWWL